MHVLVTGAAGFLGRMVVDEIVRRGEIAVDGDMRRVDTILASDIAAEPLDDLARRSDRIVPLPGSLDDARTLNRIRDAAPGLVVHFAAVVSGQAEADFDLGQRVNLHATMALLDACRAMANPPVFLFSSSVAVFSCADNDTIDEDRLPAPQSSYGTQKLVGELLVRDASRRGFVRGRSLRFPTISVRPGAPNKAASSFASGIVREPAAGLAADLPVGEGLRLHLASPLKALDYTLAAAALAQDRIGAETTITLPGISVTVGDMLAEVRRALGPDAAARVVARPDPAIERIVASWPGRIETPRARALGFAPNADFAELVREHLTAVSGGRV